MKTTNFIGALLAGSIAITSTFAAPAAAASDGDRLARILLGAAAIGSVVHTVKKNKKRRDAVARRDHYRPNQYQPRVRHNNHRPKTCLRKKYTYNGWQTFYSQRCLAEHRRRNNVRNNHGHNTHVHDRTHAHDRHGNYNNRYDQNQHRVNAGQNYNRFKKSEK